ncbi:MAG: hypothetical protein IJ151_04010, partial [Bacteroidales bacterium]|nr:hypothetical protein [Bacteroidales bacterium]
INGVGGNRSNIGGIWGWSTSGTPTLEYCLEAGTYTGIASMHPMGLQSDKGTITGCYYVTPQIGTPSNVCTVGGAQQAYAIGSTPDNLGSLVQNYGMVTAYENGILFGGLYYVEGTAAYISLTAASVFGESKYVATFYGGAQNYRLEENVKTYTISLDGCNVVFHLIGEDGRVIPSGTAVVIIASRPEATLVVLDSTTVSAHAGNILQGADTDIAKPSGTVYVLGIVGETLGFYNFTGTTIPAGKAYYVVE